MNKIIFNKHLDVRSMKKQTTKEQKKKKIREFFQNQIYIGMHTKSKKCLGFLSSGYFIHQILFEQLLVISLSKIAFLIFLIIHEDKKF